VTLSRPPSVPVGPETVPGRPPGLALPRRARGRRWDLAPVVLLAAGDWVEVVAALLFFLITGVAQWLQKRSRERRGLPPETSEEVLREPWADVPRTPPPIRRDDTESGSKPFDLEEQLRRILNPTAPPEPPPLAPALPTQHPPRFEEEPESRSWEEADLPSRPLANLESAENAYRRGAQVESNVASRLASASHLTSASEAFRNAAGLSQNVSSRLQEVLGKMAAPAPSTARLLGSTVSPAALALATTLHNPASARQAILTAFVLQPPKALEDP